jgi:integrase
MTRRTYGTGTVYPRSDGRFIGRMEAGWNTNGTRRRISVSGKTEVEVKAKLRAKRKEIDKTGITAAKPKALTVKAWSDKWLELHALEVRPKSYATDASAVRKWIVPTIGTKRLDTLTPDHVRSVHKALRANDAKPATVVRCHNVLLTMLRAAEQEGHDVAGPVLKMKPPKKGENERDAMALPHALAVLEQATTRPDASRWVAAMLNGLRPAEALGLTWDRVDLDAGTMDVTWQLMPLPYLDKHDRSKGFRVPPDHDARQLVGAYHLVRPKTKKGERILPITGWLAAALHEWRQVAPENPWGLVWTHTDRRPGRDSVLPVNAKADRAAWLDLQAAAKVKHATGRPYDLYEARHTTATLLMEAGVAPKVISAIMGHTSTRTSLIYQHETIEQMRDATNLVATRLGLEAP